MGLSCAWPAGVPIDNVRTSRNTVGVIVASLNRGCPHRNITSGGDHTADLRIRERPHPFAHEVFHELHSRPREKMILGPLVIATGARNHIDTAGRKRVSDEDVRPVCPSTQMTGVCRKVLECLPLWSGRLQFRKSLWQAPQPDRTEGGTTAVPAGLP